MSSDGGEVIRIENTYTTQQVAELLQIGKSTVSKYCRELEESGYLFFKDDRQHRAFTEHDLVALRELREILSKNIEHDSAIKTICIKHGRATNEYKIAMPDTQHESRYDERYEALEKQIKEQDEKLDKIIELQRQQNKMADMYYSNMTVAFREMIEMKTQLLAAKEEKSLLNRLLSVFTKKQ